MNDITATDMTALLAEVDALLAATAEHDARLEALLARPYHRSNATRLAELQATAAECAALSDQIDAEQAELDAELTALGL